MEGIASESSSWVGVSSIEEWLTHQRANNRTTHLDVTLITHPRDEEDFPRIFPWAKFLTIEERRTLTKCLKAGFAEVVGTPELNIGLLFLPIYADDIINSSPTTCLRLLQEDGLRVAASVGTRIVSLGGLTGVLSLYGQLLKEPAEKLGITVSTGHSTTAVSVLKTYLRAAVDLNLSIPSSRVVILGVGSVGAAFARLLVREPEQPRDIVIVDRPNRRNRLEKLVEELNACTDADVNMELTTKEGTLEPHSACYNSSFLISAISTPYVVKVEHLRPGTVLVDDSQPYCWDREDAWRRCSERKDIAPCEAGLVNCASIGYYSRFPFDFANTDAAGGSQIAWSCLAEGLLYALEPGLEPTIGEPSIANLMQYREAFDKQGFSVPPLQCGPNILPAGQLRERFAEL